MMQFTEKESSRETKGQPYDIYSICRLYAVETISCKKFLDMIHVHVQTTLYQSFIQKYLQRWICKGGGQKKCRAMHVRGLC